VDEQTRGVGQSRSQSKEEKRTAGKRTSKKERSIKKSDYKADDRKRGVKSSVWGRGKLTL